MPRLPNVWQRGCSEGQRDFKAQFLFQTKEGRRAIDAPSNKNGIFCLRFLSDKGVFALQGKDTCMLTRPFLFVGLSLF